MHKLKVLFLATSVVTGLVLAGCGDDDGSSADPDAGGGPDANVDPNNDGGPDGNASPLTLPSYVKSLIETKTAEDTAPEGETVWDNLADDDTAATSAALFPATFF